MISNLRLALCSLVLASGAWAQVNPANLQTAVNNAASGATLTVSAGTYAGQLVITKPITIVAAAGVQPIIQTPPASVVAVNIKASNVTLQGFRIQGTPWGIYAGDQNVTYTGVVLRSNVVNASGAPGHGIFLINLTGGLIESNTVQNAPVNGILVDTGSNGATVRNNTVTTTAGPDAAIKISNSSSALVYGNTVANTGNDAHGIELYGSVSSIVDSNTIVAADANGIYAANGSHNAVIINNSVLSTRKQHGLAVSNSDSAIVSGNTVTGANQFGIIIQGSKYTRVERNYIPGSGQDGIVVTRLDSPVVNSQSVYVAKNVVAMNGLALHNTDGTGIWLNSESDGSLVFGNTVSGAPENGLTSFKSSFNHYWGNEVFGNGQGGIFMYTPTDAESPYSVGNSPAYTVIQGNYVHDSTVGFGVHLRNSTFNTVFDNFILGPTPDGGSFGGLYLENTTDNSFFNNTFRTLNPGLLVRADAFRNTFFLNRQINVQQNSVFTPATIAFDGGPLFGGNFWQGYTSCQPYSRFYNIGGTFDPQYVDRYPYRDDKLGRSPAVTVHTPTQGSYASIGSRKTIEWTSNACTYVDLWYKSAGTGMVAIASNFPDTGVYNWTVPNAPLASDYTIVVDCKTSYGVSLGVISQSGAFSIAKAGIELLSPQGNNRLTGGAATTVTWRKTGVAGVDVLYRNGTGAFATLLASNATNDYVNVVVPAGGTSAGSFLIRATSDNTIADSTDGTVSVSGTPNLAITGGSLVSGTTQRVRWVSPAASNYVDLYYFDPPSSTYKPIVVNLPDFGRFDFLVPGSLISNSFLRLTFKTTPTVAIAEVGSANFNSTAPPTLGGPGSNNAPAKPAAGTVTPAGGSGSTQIFTATYTDANGGDDITLAYLMVSQNLDATNSCFIEYDRILNRFRLLSNTNSVWSASVPAGSGSASNSQCTLNGAGAGATVSGNTLTVTFPIVFAPSYTGLKNLFLLPKDASEMLGDWANKGQFTVTSSVPTSPVVVSLTPLAGNGSSGTFTAVFRHPGGVNKHYLGYLLFLKTPNVVSYTAQGSCLVEYNRFSNGVRLINDAGDNWLGPLSGVPIGPNAGVLTNSQCTVNVANVVATFSGNDMTVSYPITFNSNFTGTLATFLQGNDVDDKNTGITQYGNWVVAPVATPRPGPYFQSGTPASGAGSSSTFTVTAGQTAGVNSLYIVTLLIAPNIVGSSPCQAFYFPASDKLNLVNDSGTAFVSVSGNTPGTGGVLANSRCSLNTAAAVRTLAGNNVTLTFPMGFVPGTFSGAKNVYLNAFDNFGLLTHWVQFATYTVQ